MSRRSRRGQHNAANNKNSPSYLNDQGVHYRTTGHLEQAVKCLEGAVLADPTFLDAKKNLAICLNDLGTKHKEKGDIEKAMSLYLRAIGEWPQLPDVHYNMGVTLMEKGARDLSIPYYKETLRLYPNHILALTNLGALHKDSFQIDEAISYYERALKINPDFEIARKNLNIVKAIKSAKPDKVLDTKDVAILNDTAVMYQKSGNLKAAILYLERCLQIEPSFHMAKKNLAICYNDHGTHTKNAGDIPSAIHYYQTAISLCPEIADAHYNLGVTLMETRRIDESIPHYEEAIRQYPKHVNSYTNLGAIYKDKHQFDKAAAYYLKALEYDPTFPIANNNLAIIYSMQGKVACAHECLKRALSGGGQSNYADAFNTTGVVYRDEGETQRAIIAFKQAYKLGCAPAMDNVLLSMNDLPNTPSEIVYKAHEQWGKEFSVKFEKFPVVKPSERRKGASELLKIGYVSSDLNMHAVSYFVDAVLKYTDTTKFRNYCYYTGTVDDKGTERLKSYPSEWKKVSTSTDREIANIIRSDEIDILVDLGGHSGGNRLGVFAHKPVPIQVTWIGYPNTTGLPEVDYRFTDALADPPNTTQRFTEKLYRIPDCFLCYTPRNPPPVSPLPAISNGYITFGSFNNFAKVNYTVMDLWAKVLAKIPNSRLFMKCKPFACDSIKERVRKKFAEFGVTSDRLNLIGHLQQTTDHLDAYKFLDLALDTFPYAGTTTTCESLIMSVPVVTLRGDNHAHNVGVSLMTQIPSLRHLICDTPEQFVDICMTLSSDLESLARLRANLRDDMLNSELCNGPHYMAKVGVAYQYMWDTWQRSEDDNNETE